jgi:hypothetical protein
MVKNEAPIIAKCVPRAKQYADRVIVFDTGSTDGTMTTALEAGADEVNSVAWEGFGPTRTRCWRIAQGERRWTLILDADAYLTGPEVTPRDGVDCYYVPVQFESGGAVWRRPHVLRGNWRWVGNIHEFGDLTDGAGKSVRPQSGLLPDNLYVETTTGHRRTVPDPERLAREAEILRRDWVSNAWGYGMRWLFYYAQTLQEAGLNATASEAYRMRASKREGSAEERYVAALRAIQLAPEDDPKGLAEMLNMASEAAGSQASPRIEAHVYAAIRMSRQAPWLGYEAIRDALRRLNDDPGVPAGLFVDPDFYPRKTIEVAEHLYERAEVYEAMGELARLRRTVRT